MYKNRVFYCYSNALRRFININGIDFIDKQFHKKTGHPYWVFEQSESLGELLIEYRKNNK